MDLSDYIPVFRGTDAAGFQGLKPTEGGAYGDGIYFYTDSYAARSHATYPGGGVLTGYVHRQDAELHKDGTIVVVHDPNDVLLRGKIPLADTTLSGRAWRRRVAQALAESIGLGSPQGCGEFMNNKIEQVVDDLVTESDSPPDDDKLYADDCPFCGGVADKRYYYLTNKDSEEVFSFIECRDCHIRTCGGLSEEEAVKRWNNRINGR